MNKVNYKKRIAVGIIVVIAMCILLTITTFALVWASVSVDSNVFHTGYVKINLNDGVPVIEEREFLFEPGMTVRKEVFLENLSSWDVYYKLYFDNVHGELADVLDVTITDTDDNVYWQGKASELGKDQVVAADDYLEIGEKRYFNVYFHFPELTENEAQDIYLEFDLCADAVQTKNNQFKVFN